MSIDMTAHRVIFSGMQILIDHALVKDHAVVIEEQLIKAIIPTEMIKHHLPAKHYEFPEDHYLFPGLIDLHIHGTHGHDVMDGQEEALIAIARSLAAEGITGFLATTMTASDNRIEAVLKTIPNAMQSQEGAAILGVHLEGPFIAHEKRGAQSQEVRLPDIASIQQWQGIAKGAIKIVTLAPELPHAIPFIHALRKMEVIASIGHTNATYQETCAAIQAGCSQATHLFNGMKGLHQREPGAAGALLLSDEVMAEVIVDGLHLHPAIVELALRVKEKERLLLVTDAMRAKCLGNGQYELGGQTVNVKSGKATLADGTLAGSTLRMPQAINNMMQFTRCSLASAVSMASLNPARVLGLSERKGSIVVGKDADLAIFNAQLIGLLTMRAGKVVFRTC